MVLQLYNTIIINATRNNIYYLKNISQSLVDLEQFKETVSDNIFKCLRHLFEKEKYASSTMTIYSI